jgi:hypothetical protein
MLDGPDAADFLIHLAWNCGYIDVDIVGARVF